MRMSSRLCDSSTDARRGKASIRKARPHDGSACWFEPRAKESSRPSLTKAAVEACLRADTSAARPCCTRCRSASQRATWRGSSPCTKASRSCSAQPPLIYLPRAARLRKYREMRAGRGCNSGTDTHAGAPVTTAALGNSTTAERLRTVPRARSDGNTSNFTLNFHRK
jgi:hypothetical protein